MFAIVESRTPNVAHGDLDASPTFALADLARLSSREHHVLELDDAFGDGALLNRLPPLARLRRALLARGYRYVPEESTSSSARLVPSLQLLRILHRREIPFRKIGTVVAELLERAPAARFDDFGFFHATLGSYTSHEGAHALFYELACEHEGRPSGERLVEVLLASEGFAIAFDVWLLLQTLADERRSTKLFFSVNASASPFSLDGFERAAPGILDELAHLCMQHPAAVLRLLSALSLIVNLRPNASSARPGLVEHLAREAGLPVDRPRSLEALGKLAFSLDPDFRKTTARTFFSFHDLLGAYDAVLARPLEHHVTAGGAFHDFVPAAIATVTGEPTGTTPLGESA